MERFSVAYFMAIAAAAKLKIGRYDVDDESVDISIVGHFDIAGNVNGLKIRDPAIDFQLKCTYTHSPNSNGILKYPLKKKNYEDLRGTNFSRPKLLAVLCIPENCKQWLSSEPKGMNLYNKMYWFSLKDCGPTQNKKSVTIDIPPENILSVDAMKSFMKVAGRGELI